MAAGNNAQAADAGPVAAPCRNPAFRWNVGRLALVAAVYLLPLALLALKLHAEAAAGAAAHGAPVPLRFAVVGLFSLLMSKWCIDWMKDRR